MTGTVLYIPLCFALSFLVGSIPFGLFIARAKGVDIRQHGSGNIGATNVGRVLGRRAGLTCFFLDMGKGLVCTLLVGLAFGLLGRLDLHFTESLLWISAMAGALLGHMFSPWIGFKGGKGVATGLGSLLGIFPMLAIPGVLAFGVWWATLAVWRYVGVSSCAAAIALPALVVGQYLIWLTITGDALPRGGSMPFVFFTGALAALVIYKHRGNLSRTFKGTEPKVGRGGSLSVSEPDANQPGDAQVEGGPATEG